MSRWFLVALIATGVACAADPLANPTGSCEPSGNGARPGYHAPAGSTWLPDCANPLRREYWRVFAKGPSSAYTMPRLDGERRLMPVCTDPQNELNALVHIAGGFSLIGWYGNFRKNQPLDFSSNATRAIAIYQRKP